MKNLKNTLTKRKIELLGSLLLVVVFVLPFLTFASSRKDMYVDGSRAGVENGSQASPYRTISEALVHADKKTDVHVAKGVYLDNIEIPSGVRVFGSDQNDVIIRAKNEKKVVVSMKDDTEINKVTIEKGNEGIWIKKDAKVSIVKCVVKNNDEDGIKIASGSTKKRDAVSITESIIKNNGRAGVYSQKRRLVLMENEISENESDGVDLAVGTSAWIEGNEFKDNEGSGLKVRLDESDIWTKSNKYRDNKNSGIEIDAYGKAGRVDINKSKFSENKDFAIARISRNAVAGKIWDGLSAQTNNTFEMSKKGNVSSIIRLK